MKTKSSFFLAAMLALSGAGCASVTVSKPIGEKPHALDKAAWEGIWQIDREVARVTVSDGANGWLKVAGFKEKDGATTVETNAICIMEAGGWLVANVRDEHDGHERYTWGRIKIDGDQVVGWEPSLEKFRALVRDKKLRGTLDGDDVNLEALTAAETQALTSGALGQVLEWETPFFLRRIAR